MEKNEVRDENSLLIADKDAVFSMEIENTLKPKQIRNLTVESVRTEGDLMSKIPRLKPQVLVLGDLQNKFEEQEKSNQIPFISELLDAIPNMMIVHVSVDQLMSHPSLEDRIVSFEKPVDINLFVQLVSDWLDEPVSSGEPN
jgi:hypothetical protein